MAETATIEPKPGFEDLEKKNADVAAKLLEQDTIQLAKPEDFRAAGDALDALAATKPDPDAEPPPAPEPKPEDVEAKKLSEAAAKETAEKAAKEAEHAKKAEEYFKDVPGLPPGASPKSSEAFATIKVKAAQEISAREAELEKLKTELKTYQEKLKNPVPPELAKEVEDLRNWRAKLDVEFDPKFKEFDKQVASAHEFIYAQLKTSPVVTDAMIEKIQKLGGPEKVDMPKLFDAIKDPIIQRMVESKMADVAHVNFNKNKAIEEAKSNISQYQKQQQETFAATVNGHREATANELRPMVDALGFLQEKTPDEKADAATKKAIAEQNEWVKTTNGQMMAALQDDSPRMRATLVAGTLQLFNLQRIHEKVLAEKTALEKANGELTAKLDKIKSSATSRLRESAAPADGKTPRLEKKNDFTTHAVDALDALAKQVMESKKAAGV
jgi:hypothetical protein